MIKKIIGMKRLSTIETIEKSNIPLISIGMTMMEVIQLFWNRIHAKNFTEEILNIKISSKPIAISPANPSFCFTAKRNKSNKT